MYRNRFLALAIAVAATVALPAPALARDDAASPATACSRVTLARDASTNPLPVGALVPCPGIRPGAWVETSGSVCTLNFVFHATRIDEEGNLVDEGLFIGTAGHCVIDAGEVTYEPGAGAPAADADRRRFGEVAYAINDDANHDFALIRIDDAREREVRPALCHFGGPVRMTNAAAFGQLVHHFGQGIGYGDTVPGRSGDVISGSLVTAPDGTIFAGSALFGDSGSPVITDRGEALGVLVAILPPAVFVTNIAPQLARAERALALDFELVPAAFS